MCMVVNWEFQLFLIYVNLLRDKIWHVDVQEAISAPKLWPQMELTKTRLQIRETRLLFHEKLNSKAVIW